MSPLEYEIRVEGHLGGHWADWFAGWQILHDEDEATLLRGEVVDQSALYGILSRLSGLNLTLISVYRVGPIENMGKHKGEKIFRRSYGRQDI
ncbi:hypothetical protein ACFLU3_04385 [Chloroflexota bacterium]